LSCCDDIKYILDEAQPYELDIYIKKYNQLERSNWEQTRFIAYIIAQCNSKKKLKPDDILKFDWDIDNNKSNDDIENINSAENRAKIVEQMKLAEAELNTKPIDNNNNNND